MWSLDRNRNRNALETGAIHKPAKAPGVFGLVPALLALKRHLRGKMLEGARPGEPHSDFTLFFLRTMYAAEANMLPGYRSQQLAWYCLGKLTLELPFG
jgi:hypothetical protein